MKKRDWYNTEGLYREGEENIAKYGGWSIDYVVDKLKGRFRAGETSIKRNGYWDNYINYLKQKGIEV